MRDDRAVSSLASVIGAPFGIAVGQAFGWRSGIAAFAGIAILGFAVFAVFYKFHRNANASPPQHLPVSESPADARTGARRPAHRDPVVWVLAGSLGLLNMGGFTITFFVPAALKTLFNLGPMQAADVISAAYITAIFANLLFGYIADRLNRFTVMIIIAALLIPASLAMMSSNLLLFRIGAAILVAAGLSATNPVISNEEAYRAVVRAASKQDLLRQTVVHRAGHCVFSSSEQIARY
jgi:predicted MFS family arabinose efflux permease